MVSGKMSVHTYNSIIRMLVNAKLVKQSNFLLTWIGDDADAGQTPR